MALLWLVSAAKYRAHRRRRKTETGLSRLGGSACSRSIRRKTTLQGKVNTVQCTGTSKRARYRSGTGECRCQGGFWRKRMRFFHFAVLLLAWVCGTAQAAGGPLGIDHEIGFDQSGIWARKYQTAL